MGESLIKWSRSHDQDGRLIGDDEKVTWLTLEQIPSNISEAFANLGISNLSARSLEKYLS